MICFLFSLFQCTNELTNAQREMKGQLAHAARCPKSDGE